MVKETMCALVYEGPRELNMRQVPVPRPEKGEVLVRVQKVGICGSELSGYLGQNSLRKPPLVMGHEFAGRIAEIGEGVTAFQVGDRVTANPLVSCGKCLDCQSGYANLCEKRVLIGAGMPGAFAEYVRVPSGNVLPLEENVPMDDGALTEPFACAVRIAALAELKPYDSLLIIGAGPIGLLTLRVAQLYGVNRVVVMDLNEDRLSIVKAMGGIPAANAEQLKKQIPVRGFRKSVDAVGLEVTRQQCVEYTRPGGTVVFSGLHHADSQLPINSFIRNELTFRGSFGYTPADFHFALKWISEKGLQLDQWMEKVPLEEGKACFEKLLSDPGPVAKFILEVEPESSFGE
ncbi:alcohol dehydrogenase catalytic domain-containing protein [Paenibacillus cisolokensis]|uniref:zinc-dependent alcohol dehydrogenase n=1 Tax=Paenibacillus cisolokensis TaxID=1658519 RepID=UPI003D270FE2